MVRPAGKIAFDPERHGARSQGRQVEGGEPRRDPRGSLPTVRSRKPSRASPSRVRPEGPAEEPLDAPSPRARGREGPPARDEAALERLLHCAEDLLRSGARFGRVDDRACRRWDPHSMPDEDVVPAEGAARRVEGRTGGPDPVAPRSRHREMDRPRDHVAQPEEVEGALVGDDRLRGPRGEPRRDDVFLRGGGVLGESVEPLPDSEEPPSSRVVGEEGPAEAAAEALGGREVSGLPRGDLEEPAVIGSPGRLHVMERSNNTFLFHDVEGVSRRGILPRGVGGEGSSRSPLNRGESVVIVNNNMATRKHAGRIEAGFGASIREARAARVLGLRELWRRSGLEPARVSRIERGLAPAPADPSSLRRFARGLGLALGSPAWKGLADLAALSRGRMPRDLLTDPQIAGRLPVLFRALRDVRSDRKL